MYFWLRLALLLVCMMVTGVSSAKAQDIVQSSSLEGMTTGSNFGQSFTATVTGNVTSISVATGDVVNATLHLYSGSSTTVPLGGEDYSQVVSLPNSGGAMTEIVLDTPFPVVAGQTYTFLFPDIVSLYYGGANPYSGGQMAYEELSFAGLDLKFIVKQQIPAPAPVPTLTEWAMIGLGVALAGGAAVLVQRRRTVRMAL